MGGSSYRHHIAASDSDDSNDDPIFRRGYREKFEAADRAFDLFTPYTPGVSSSSRSHGHSSSSRSASHSHGSSSRSHGHGSSSRSHGHDHGRSSSRSRSHGESPFPDFLDDDFPEFSSMFKKMGFGDDPDAEVSISTRGPDGKWTHLKRGGSSSSSRHVHGSSSRDHGSSSRRHRDRHDSFDEDEEESESESYEPGPRAQPKHRDSEPKKSNIKWAKKDQVRFDSHDTTQPARKGPTSPHHNPTFGAKGLSGRHFWSGSDEEEMPKPRSRRDRKADRTSRRAANSSPPSSDDEDAESPPRRVEKRTAGPRSGRRAQSSRQPRVDVTLYTVPVPGTSTTKCGICNTGGDQYSNSTGGGLCKPRLCDHVYHKACLSDYVNGRGDGDRCLKCSGYESDE